jgi:AraC-like DNA-binding protein/mannose-6-phosphate isomerase-like protein (cupin superfamily)
VSESFVASILRPRGVLAGFHVEGHDLTQSLPGALHIGEHWVPPTYSIGKHKHNVWEFLLQVSGTSRWSGLGRDYDLSAGALFAVAPGVRHWLVHSTSAKQHYFYAAFDMETVFTRHEPLRAAFGGQKIICIENAASLQVPFRTLLGEATQSSLYRNIGLQLALDALVIQAARVVQDDAPETLGHPAVARVRLLLAAEPQRAWPLDELARESGLSANHLCELFTKETGMSPRRYLLQTRIDRACQTLATSDASVAHIALELGFASSQHFAATFRRFTGTTPLQWRKTHKS